MTMTMSATRIIQPPHFISDGRLLDGSGGAPIGCPASSSKLSRQRGEKRKARAEGRSVDRFQRRKAALHPAGSVQETEVIPHLRHRLLPLPFFRHDDE